MRSVFTNGRAVAALAAAILAGGCHSSQKPKQPPATPVRVAAASRIDAPVTLAASGVVEPMQTVAVTTQVTGTLQDVLFREGEYVDAGRVLFHIDPRPLQAAVDQARATLGRDEAQATAGQRDDIRYQTLAAKGFVSRSQADQIHATALAQQATVEADRAALRAAQVNLGYATLRAPISGRTGGLLVRRGNIVSPSSGPLVVINQIRPVLVRFPISDQDFPSVQHAIALHPLPVIASSSDSTQAAEHGTLSFLDNAIDSLTGTVTGKATFPNAGSRLWPGELVFLTVQLDVQRGVLAVPNEAIMTGQQGEYVFVIDARNTAQMRNVSTGLTVGDLTVVAQGLTDGERVVIDGQSRLNPNARVAILGSDTAATGRLSSTGEGGATGVVGGDVTGVARPGATTPNAAARAGGSGTATGVAAGVGAAAGRSGGTVAPAPSMSGLTGNGTTAGGARTTGMATTGTAATTGTRTTTSVPNGIPVGASPTTTGTVTTGSGGVTRSTTTTTTTTTPGTTPATARPGTTTPAARPPTPTTPASPQRP